MTPYYPICVDLRGRRCVVVGGGTVAARKVDGLLECGAEVTVVAPILGPVLKEYLRAGRSPRTCAPTPTATWPARAWRSPRPTSRR